MLILYVDNILALFDHLLSFIDSFNLIKVYIFGLPTHLPLLVSVKHCLPLATTLLFYSILLLRFMNSNKGAAALVEEGRERDFSSSWFVF